ECSSSHTHCLPYTGDTTLLPKRVIDVGRVDSLDEPHLLVTEEMYGDYLALSHCWGQFPQFTTTLETLLQRVHSIPIAELPKTFADAVLITHSLGFRYLWIDSLCILQNLDKKDWGVEVGNMSSIYQNARMTIAATSAAESREGCFPSRIAPFASDRTVLKIRIDKSSCERVTSEWAWVLQEIILSPRVLFFAQNLVYWMCAECVASEDGLYKDEDCSSIIQRPQTLKSELYQRVEESSLFLNGTPALIALWYDFVEDYSSRHLTHSSDKLGAIAGMTRHFRNEMCNEMPAMGLWESDLRHGILW
ncbi:HET-domain-containing protein, partial [Lophium mytilinum]